MHKIKATPESFTLKDVKENIGLIPLKDLVKNPLNY
jgi:hypothetical protein